MKRHGMKLSWTVPFYTRIFWFEAHYGHYDNFFFPDGKLKYFTPDNKSTCLEVLVVY